MVHLQRAPEQRQHERRHGRHVPYVNLISKMGKTKQKPLHVDGVEAKISEQDIKKPLENRKETLGENRTETKRVTQLDPTKTAPKSIYIFFFKYVCCCSSRAMSLSYLLLQAPGGVAARNVKARHVVGIKRVLLSSVKGCEK